MLYPEVDQSLGRLSGISTPVGLVICIAGALVDVNAVTGTVVIGTVAIGALVTGVDVTGVWVTGAVDRGTAAKGAFVMGAPVIGADVGFGIGTDVGFCKGNELGNLEDGALEGTIGVKVLNDGIEVGMVDDN